MDHFTKLITVHKACCLELNKLRVDNQRNISMIDILSLQLNDKVADKVSYKRIIALSKGIISSFNIEGNKNFNTISGDTKIKKP